MQALAVGLLVLGAVGCSRSSAQDAEEKAELGPELKSLVLEQAPSDLPNPSFVDFGGKVQLLGYALEPTQLAAPQSKVSLKLFWRSTGKLSEGFRPYTELVTPAGKRFDIQGTGPVRQGALSPPSWEPGKIYIDELQITVPEEIDAPRFAIVVGLKTAPIAPEEPEAAKDDDGEEKAEKKPADEKPAGTFGDVYLPVLSGLADRQHGAIVATLETGVTPGAKRARAAKDEKRAPGGVRRAPGAPGKPPLSARPREPGARPAPPAEPKQ
jgi:hypothetical protein